AWAMRSPRVAAPSSSSPRSRPGARFSTGPELLARDEAERPLGVGRRELDGAHGADRDDQPTRLVACVAVRSEGEEAEARVRARGRDRVTGAVHELDTHLGLLEPVLLRELGGHAREPTDELVQRSRSAGCPNVGRHQKSPSGLLDAPMWSRPRAVMTRPRGVRCTNPSWSKYGSEAASMGVRPPPGGAAGAGQPPRPPPDLAAVAPA